MFAWFGIAVAIFNDYSFSIVSIAPSAHCYFIKFIVTLYTFSCKEGKGKAIPVTGRGVP
jgi:hypothetical protein